MPAVGLGLWKIAADSVAERVYQAIAAGYRHLDSASDYGNERQVGEGIARALADGLCQRGDLWITSKLWNTYHRREHVEAACRKSLEDLGAGLPRSLPGAFSDCSGLRRFCRALPARVVLRPQRHASSDAARSSAVE